MISWDQRRSGVDNQPLRGEHQLCSFSGFAFFCMLTLPLMVLKLIPQLDMFVLRPKIETTRWNVVRMFILLWLSFRVGFLFLVGYFLGSEESTREKWLCNIFAIAIKCFVFVLLVISKVSWQDWSDMLARCNVCENCLRTEKCGSCANCLKQVQENK